MNPTMDKNKILALNRHNSIIQDDDMYSNVQIPNSSSPQQTKKHIERLQKLAKEQKQKRQEIQNKYQHFKQRVVVREHQFHRILSKFDTKIASDFQKEDYDNYVTEIYNRILCTFQAFNQKAKSLLDDRYSELYRLMERRIDILMQKMNKELAKYRKVSLAERKQIQEAIKQIGVIAAETQSENVEFRRKNQEMELKLKILKDEKKLLLEEITNLKAFVKDGVKTGVYKQKEKQKTGVYKQKEKQQNTNSDFWNNTESMQIQIVPSPKMNQRRSLKTSRNRYQQSQPKKSQNSKPFNQHQTIDMQKLQRQSVSQQNIISHLRQQLQREKNRNSQLLKFSLELQAKQLKIIQLWNSQIGIIATKATQNSKKSLIQSGNDDKVSDTEFSAYDRKEQVIVEGNKINVSRQNSRTKHAQTKPHIVIDTKNMNSQKIQKQLQQLQKKFYNFVSCINKILQLPQNSTVDTKSLNNHLKTQNLIDKTTLITRNLQVQDKFQHSMVNFNRASPKQPNQIDFPQAKQTHKNQSFLYKSTNKRYETKNRPKRNSVLFTNYSPLDIVDITKSIQIK